MSRTLLQYIIGFAGSIIITLAAYIIVAGQLLSGWTAAGVVIGLAAAQTIVQLTLFLHIQDDGRPRWKLHSVLFLLFALAIVVGGSLWVMASLNDRMMPTSSEMQDYMHRQEIKGL